VKHLIGVMLIKNSD